MPVYRICTKENPMPRAVPHSSDYIAHARLQENLPVQVDKSYDVVWCHTNVEKFTCSAGCCINYRCPNCDYEWLEEIPVDENLCPQP